MTATKKTAKAKKRTTRKTLTTKQQRFVDLYDGNATEAARKAGYKGNDITLGQVGAENLKKPHIAEAIKVREDKRNKPLIADRQERQEFWTSVMRGDELVKVKSQASGRIIEVERSADLKDRQKASELLGRSEADFTDKHKVGTEDGKPFTFIMNLGGDPEKK